MSSGRARSAYVAHAGWSETLGKRLQAQEVHVAALRDRKKALVDASTANGALRPIRGP
ncbi:MAG TPA: hypothetical protein VNB29_02955 [Chthoniobacterales bacterium]|jgi:hypothetical protein|nr:hypothetical protein [Chthoniobacterales bacterium]